jgi:TPR repeat protein
MTRQTSASASNGPIPRIAGKHAFFLLCANLVFAMMTSNQDARGQAPVPGAAIYQQAVARYQAGDHAGAAVLVRRAAEAGNPTATYEMGYLCENGDGVRKDPAQSAQWYLRGARMGNAASEAAVGQLYEYGNQVQENWDTAAQWYTKSAQQGYVMGEFRLGRAYQYGVGIPINISAAAQWYGRAAAQGDSQSAFFAKYIRDNPGIDTTWYSAQEKAIMAPYQMQPWMLRPPLTGRVFHNVNQRLAYFEAWAHNAAAYTACVSAHVNAPCGTAYRCPAPALPN